LLQIFVISSGTSRERTADGDKKIFSLLRSLLSLFLTGNLFFIKVAEGFGCGIQRQLPPP
jgi:hypothetical protein